MCVFLQFALIFFHGLRLVYLYIFGLGLCPSSGSSLSKRRETPLTPRVRVIEDDRVYIAKEFIVRLLNALFSITKRTRCQRAYYAALESLGYPKRSLMLSRINTTVTAQHQATHHFKDALENLSTLIQFNGGDLEKMYKLINNTTIQSQACADHVQQRIDAIDDVASVLFQEWRDELALYTSDKLRKESEKKLIQTEKHYQQMHAAMQKAQNMMQPALSTLKDHSLFLKHNLNACAITALRGEFKSLAREINRAIREMEAAIHKSHHFITLLDQVPIKKPPIKRLLSDESKDKS